MSLISAKLKQAIRDGRPYVLMTEIDHPDGLDYRWTGIGDLNWDGKIWKGIGSLGTISAPSETADLAVREIAFELRGIQQDQVKWLSTNVRNREATAWIGFLDKRNQIIDTLELFSCVLDYQELPVDEAGNVTIRLTARTGFYSIERAQNISWTNERQRVDYPDDDGLSLIPSLQDKDVKWLPAP